ncbi:phosphate ABC transporter substrate-binding protein [Alcaligenes faecalis subsp. faecalis NCIB 8687]|uniref:Phosphate-binding protein n=1 Tax=Alcaligenes faecalis TaxID=511 RepID=Q6WB54_ALCFA|nr:phosphate-binding protein [Alcaligenes faecalis subsp. faecalis NCIB 8687]EJC61967.1 phosphate ABC transporter substrate-binding protein [Alcaligenes faecalis subsp. faecalis NCIB 8687]
MKLTKLASAVAILAAAGSMSAASAQEVPTVLIDGSSTVFPISEAVAEEFQNAQKGKTRVTVGVSGTGGGFKKFCRGELDITGASRPIKKEEMELCKQNGVEFIEMPIVIDALATIINPQNNWAECLSVAELKKMWEPEAQGKITNWNQINSKFPDAPLVLFGAGTDSGTYDYYTFAIVGKEHSSRGDFTATEDDNVSVQGVARDKNAIGFLGLAYYDHNKDKIKPVAIRQADGSCVLPSVETAVDGTYQPLTRPIFYYVDKSKADKKHVADFIHFAFDPKNQQELISEVGYVSLPAEIANAATKKFDSRKTGSHFDGGSKVGVKMADLVN